jgi:hypothetical protein
MRGAKRGEKRWGEIKSEKKSKARKAKKTMDLKSKERGK